MKLQHVSRCTAPAVIGRKPRFSIVHRELFPCQRQLSKVCTLFLHSRLIFRCFHNVFVMQKNAKQQLRRRWRKGMFPKLIMHHCGYHKHIVACVTVSISRAMMLGTRFALFSVLSVSPRKFLTRAISLTATHKCRELAGSFVFVVSRLTATLIITKRSLIMLMLTLPIEQRISPNEK